MNQTFMRTGFAAFASLALIFLPACQQASGSATIPISLNDTRTLSTEALQDRLIAQLDSILSPAPTPPRWVRVTRGDQLENLWLATAPRRDEGGDFCTYDLLRVSLAPDASAGEIKADTPMHATSIETTNWFAPNPGSMDCAGSAPGVTHYFETDQPLRVDQDYAMLKDALTRLQAAPADFRLDCAETEHCSKLYKATKAETLWDIRACGYVYPEGNCRHYSWREPEYVEMDIIFDTPKLDRRIVRVHVEPGVVL